MSDAKLRDLERRWKESGTVEDEAAYLLERVRAGDLSQERLELAAYCGHEGARGAVTDVIPLDSNGLYERFAALDHGTRMIALDAALDAALPIWRSHDSAPGPVTAAIDAVRRWLDAPSEESVARCKVAAFEAHAIARSLAGPNAATPVESVATAATQAAVAASSIPGRALQAFASAIYALDNEGELVTGGLAIGEALLRPSRRWRYPQSSDG